MEKAGRVDEGGNPNQTEKSA